MLKLENISVSSLRDMNYFFFLKWSLLIKVMVQIGEAELL